MVVAEVCSSMKYPKRCQYKHAKQKKYHVRNWAEYNEGLRRRGDLTVWFDEEEGPWPLQWELYTILATPVSWHITCAFYLFIRQPHGWKSALRREIPWILRGFQGRLSC